VWSSLAPSRIELELGAGGFVPIPQQTPHKLRNSGPDALCAVFATASPVSTFDEPVMPAAREYAARRADASSDVTPPSS
jgi:hypothetical protein